MRSTSSPGVEVLDLVEDEALAPDDPARGARRTPGRRPRGRRRRCRSRRGPRCCRPPSAASDGLADWRAGPAGGPPARTRARRPPRACRGSSRLTMASVSPSRNSISSCDELVVARRLSISPTHGPGALLDVEQEARPAEALVAVELVVRAGADRERAQQQVERLADGVGVRVGPEVAHALALAAPHHHRPGATRRRAVTARKG